MSENSEARKRREEAERLARGECPECGGPAYVSTLTGKPELIHAATLLRGCRGG